MFSHSMASKAPKKGWMKMNVDAGKIGGVWYLFDCCRSKIKREYCSVVLQFMVPTSWETHVAEGKVVYKGVMVAKEQYYSKVMVGSDSL